MLNFESTPFRLAIKMANASDSKWRVGACLTRKNRIISAGFNQIKTHPFTRTFKNKMIRGLHAEMHTCIGIEERNLIGTTIYVVRIRKSGSFGMAKPCRECYNFLANLRVKHVYYSTDLGEIDYVKINSG